VTSTTQDPTEDVTAIRETYEEFELGDATVAMISDPHVDDAWIQSNVVEQVAP
jgi:hypothetical protein